MKILKCPHCDWDSQRAWKRFRIRKGYTAKWRGASEALRCHLEIHGIFRSAHRAAKAELYQLNREAGRS